MDRTHTCDGEGPNPDLGVLSIVILCIVTPYCAEDDEINSSGDQGNPADKALEVPVSPIAIGQSLPSVGMLAC